MKSNNRTATQEQSYFEIQQNLFDLGYRTARRVAMSYFKSLELKNLKETIAKELKSEKPNEDITRGIEIGIIDAVLDILSGKEV